jgi:hypothetical protein
LQSSEDNNHRLTSLLTESRSLIDSLHAQRQQEQVTLRAEMEQSHAQAVEAQRRAAELEHQSISRPLLSVSCRFASLWRSFASSAIDVAQDASGSASLSQVCDLTNGRLHGLLARISVEDDWTSDTIESALQTCIEVRTEMGELLSKVVQAAVHAHSQVAATEADAAAAMAAKDVELQELSCRHESEETQWRSRFDELDAAGQQLAQALAAEKVSHAESASRLQHELDEQLRAHIGSAEVSVAAATERAAAEHAAELAALQREHAAEVAQSRSALQAQVDSLSRECAAAAARRASEHSEARGAARLGREAETLRAELEALSSERQRERGAAAALQGRVEVLEAEGRRLRSALDEQQLLADERQRHVAALEAEARTLQNSLDERFNEGNVGSPAISRAVAEAETKMQAELQQLHTELGEKARELAQSQAARQQAGEQAQAELGGARAELARWQARCEESDAAGATLLSRARRAAEQLEAEQVAAVAVAASRAELAEVQAGQLRSELAGQRDSVAEAEQVRAAVASFEAAVLTEIYLCNVCSCQEILRRSGRG